MTDRECVELLSWALPRLGLRWKGFWNVRRQVEKRVARRLRELELPTAAAYRDYLAVTPEEWPVLAHLCRVTITRFYRDHGVFRALETQVLPSLAAQAARQGRSELAVWSAGCAGGEEAYTVALVWHLEVQARPSAMGLRLLGTDIDAEELERARAGRYPHSALAELPHNFVEAGFEPMNGCFRVRDDFRRGVEFRLSDLTKEMPGEQFDLILCRNLAFTYYDDPLRRETARRLAGRMPAGGVLVVGKHEVAPQACGFSAMSQHEGLYERDG